MKFIRDIISEKRAQATGDAAAGAADELSAYVLTRDAAVPDASPSSAAPYYGLEDDEPASIGTTLEETPELADMLGAQVPDANQERAQTYDLDLEMEAELEAESRFSGEDDFEFEREDTAEDTAFDAYTSEDADAVPEQPPLAEDHHGFEEVPESETDMSEEASGLDDDNIFNDLRDADLAEETDVKTSWTGEMPRMQHSEEPIAETTEIAGAAEQPEADQAENLIEQMVAAQDVVQPVSDDMLAEAAPEHARVATMPPMPQTKRVVNPEATVSADPAAAVDVPAPAAGRGGRRAGRVKTRLLGFNGGQGASDPLAQANTAADEARQFTEFPVGWLVVVDGPGRGSAFTIYSGVAQIGRGEGQNVRLDFGDTSISRENHAAIAYDPELRKFYLGHGGKANLVRLNNRPVLSTEELANGNLIRIGETTIRFVALCGEGFDWSAKQEGDLRHVSFV